MPVYEYLCDRCGNRFEQYRRPSDRTTARCPECRARGRKVFRPVGIIFKGPGFHSTDYRREKKTAGEEKEGKAQAPAGPGKEEQQGSS